MTIKKYIIDGTITSLMDRENKLKEMGAPTIMITSIGEEIDRLMKGILKCSGDTDLLEEEYVSVPFGIDDSLYCEYSGIEHHNIADAKAEKAKADKDPQVISSKIEFWEAE